MTGLSNTLRADTRPSGLRKKTNPLYRCFGYALCALMLLVSGNAFAVITVNLEIANPVDSNGNITVIKNSKLVVEFDVVEDTDKDLNKNDKILLLRVSDDSVVDSETRGMKKFGKVKLKVKSEGEQLYVQYVRRGSAGTVITRISHPDDGDTPLLSIAKAKVDDLTLGLNEMRVGAASIHGWAFKNENTGTTQETQCQWRMASSYAYYRIVAGATGASCDAFASIQLPQGRKLTSLTCLVFDNSGADGNSNALSFYLTRASLTTGTTQSIFSTPSSLDSTSVQQLSDTTPVVSAAIVDNANYAYYVFGSFSSNDFSNLGSNGRIYGCNVSYE